MRIYFCFQPQLIKQCREYSPGNEIRVFALNGFKDVEFVYEIPCGDNRVALVFGDTLFNLQKCPGTVIDRIVSRLFGSIGPLKVTRLGRWTMVKDHTLARKSLGKLASQYESEGKFKEKFVLVLNPYRFPYSCCDIRMPW